MKRVIPMIVLLFAVKAFSADKTCVIPERSHFRIHVGTAGLFKMFAHDHVLEAKAIDGCATIDTANLQDSSIELRFAANGIRVLDPKESEENRAKIQKTMETEVLRVSEYPVIAFESTSIEKTNSPGQFRVIGKLTIRGKTQPASVLVRLNRLDDRTYRSVGEHEFKQSDFGIEPVKLAGGTVRVKDEIRTEFELYLK